MQEDASMQEGEFVPGVSRGQPKVPPLANGLASPYLRGLLPPAAPTVLTLNRVAHLGGVERIILGTASAAAAHGFRPVLACPMPGRLADAMAEQGFPVQPARIERGRMPRSPRQLVRTWHGMRAGAADVLALARREDASLLHVHHPVTALQARLASRVLKIPLLIHVHETLPMPRLYRLLARLAQRQCDKWICVSEASRQMVRSLGVSADRTELIYNAADERFFRPVTPAPELAAGGPHIGVFAVLEPRKGHKVLLQALAQLASRTSARLWIVGEVSFGEHQAYRLELERLATELGLAERVCFLGHRDDIAPLMAGMDVVVLPSLRAESLPTVLLEAVSLGRPSIGTDVGGVAEIIADGRTGLVVPPGEPQALAEALMAMLSQQGAVMAKRAHAEARRKFAPDVFGARLAACYRDLIAARRHTEEASAHA